MLKKIIKLIMDYLSKLSVEQEELLGVDITPGAVRVVQLSEKDDKWTVNKLGYKYLDGNHNLALIKENTDLYVDKLKQIVTANNITTKNVAVSIPVSSAIIKVVSIPLMSDEELQEAVDTKTLWENTVQLADNLEEYSVFWQTLSRDTKKNSMDLLFVASKLDEVNEYIKIIKNSGLNPVVMDVRCFAIRNALELREDLDTKKSPIVIVEFGPYENYILILYKDAPFVSDIYLSEKLKIALNSGTTKDVSNEEVVNRLSMQISQMVSAYQSKYKTPNIENILITSVVSNLENMISIFENRLDGYQVKIFDAFKKIIVPENIKKKSSAEQNQSMFCSVLGLATRKLDVFGYYEYVTGTNNINLLPDRDGVKDQEKLKFLSRWGVAIFGVFAVLVSIYTFIDVTGDVSEIETSIIEYDELIEQKNTLKGKFIDLNEKKSYLDQTLNIAKSSTRQYSKMYDILVALNKSVPEGISLKRIDYRGGNEVNITGLSVSEVNILAFIENLPKKKSIAKASLITMAIEKTEKGSFRSFSIRCILVDIVQPTTKGKEK